MTDRMTTAELSGDLKARKGDPLAWLAAAKIETLQTENTELRDVLQWSEQNCPNECKGPIIRVLERVGKPRRNFFWKWPHDGMAWFLWARQNYGSRWIVWRVGPVNYWVEIAASGECS